MVEALSLTSYDVLTACMIGIDKQSSCGYDRPSPEVDMKLPDGQVLHAHAVCIPVHAWSLAALVCAYVVLVLCGRMEPELNEDR